MNEGKRQDRAAHPEKFKRWGNAYYRRSKPRRRAYNLGKLYGITMEQYEAMLVLQGGKCALCYRVPEGRGNCSVLHVDHNHETGQVRRLLCFDCNNGLGRFRDDPDVLRRAVAYLEAFRG